MGTVPGSYTRIANLIIYKPRVACDLFLHTIKEPTYEINDTVSQTETWIKYCIDLKCLSL